MTYNDIIIKDTHRGLLYRDGVMVRVLEAGHYRVRRAVNFWLWRRPRVEIVLIDVRERDLTIKGQEILTSDKVAIRVSIIVQFRVTDPLAALHAVESYEERIYTDVQLAARRSLASMTLEQILTNRNQLSEDILRDVQDAASRYGVAILRADVKDLIFPGNLQDVMNKVLASERLREAQLVEARTKADVQRIDAFARAEARRTDAEAQAQAQLLLAQHEAEVQRIKTEADITSLHEREQAARAYTTYPALMRLQELETLSDLSRTANARIYINFDSQARINGSDPTE